MISRGGSSWGRWASQGLLLGVGAALGVALAVGGVLVPAAILVCGLVGMALAAPAAMFPLLLGAVPLYDLAVVSMAGVADVRVLELAWLAAAIGLCLQVVVVSDRRLWRVPRGFAVLMLLLLALESASALVSQYGLRSWVEVAQTAYLGIVAWSTGALFVTANASRRRMAARLAGAVVILAVVWAIVQLVVPGMSTPRLVVGIGPGLSAAVKWAAPSSQIVGAAGIATARLGLLNLGAVYSAALLCVSLSLGLSHALGTDAASRQDKAFAWVVVVASSAGLLLTFSRMGWLVGALCVVAILIRAGSTRAIAGVVAVLMILLSLSFIPSFSGRMSEFTDTREGSFSTHLRMWATAIHMSEMRPALGWGPGAFKEVGESLGVARSIGNVFDARDAHNFVLQEAADAGIPAAMVLLAVCTVVLLSNRRTVAEDRLVHGLWVGCAAVIAMSLTMNALRTELPWALMGLLMAHWPMSEKYLEGGP